jgi:hypothetical protein
VDLEEASGTQHLELNSNSGDDADYYRQGNNISFTATTVPNNLSYSGTPLGLSITMASATGSNMTFTVGALPVDHFEWAAIASPRTNGVPFPVTLTAKDSLGATTTNFAGAVSLGIPGDLDASITASANIGAIKAAGTISGTIRAGKDAKGNGIASITATGGMEDATVVANGSIGKISTSVLIDTDILVGVASDFAGSFAGHDDFTNPAAKLGSLKVTGQKLPAGQNHPAYVANSHISAANVGTLGLLNVPADAADAGPTIHVFNDVGTLQISQTKLVAESMFPSGTSKTAATRPTLWQVA